MDTNSLNTSPGLELQACDVKWSIRDIYIGFEEDAGSDS